MPQLDFSIFPSQFFWLCVSFFLMLFIMSKFIIPKTAEMINLRKAKIDADLAAAEELKQKVEKTLEKYNQALKKASDEANASLQKTREELNTTIERRQQELAQELNAEIAAGEKKIAAAKQKALGNVEAMVAELTPLVLKKIGFAKVSAKEIQTALKMTENK